MDHWNRHIHLFSIVQIQDSLQCFIKQHRYATESQFKKKPPKERGEKKAKQNGTEIKKNK